MLEDVVNAISESSLVERTTILTPDKQVMDHAAALGVMTMADQTEQGINESIAIATKYKIEGKEWHSSLGLTCRCPLG